MSDATKFTPGPWSVGPPHVVRHQFQDTQGRRVTEWIAESVGQHPPGEIEANAHLIAAAPDLFEALERCRARLLVVGQIGTKDEVALNLARAALAKARGDQS